MSFVRFRRFAAAVVILGWTAIAASGGEVPTPESHLGYKPGADYRLAEWSTVVDYFRKVDEASPRVVVRTLGESTEGRPFLVAIVSSEKTIESLDTYRQYQQKLADPRKLADAREAETVIGESKPAVLITCTIHSSETASTLMSMELLHGLATGEDRATKEILDNTTLLLVPSVNPDGVDKVARWYAKTRGKPWEGSGMPELYHVYAGHDTNRDWYMLNLKETQILTRLLYKDWFPTITYDVHQMGSSGARLFVPPFFDPINPNLHPRLSQSIALIGSHMALDLASAGKRGILTHAMYDNWWNGGNRTTPQRHNMVGVLTEAASVKLATPIFIDKADLKGTTRGFTGHQPAVNFVDPWPGGWWRLRDIVDYELICARSILTLAARYRRDFQENYLAMGRESVERGRNEPPYGWVVPADQPDPGRAANLVNILRDTGVEVSRAVKPIKLDGATYPAGSWVFPASQPYRPHLKDMMERQAYPARFRADGTAEPPYDVAGWTLPLLLDVRTAALGQPLPTEGLEPVEKVEVETPRIEASESEGYLIDPAPNSYWTLVERLRKAGLEAGVVTNRLSSPEAEIRLSGTSPEETKWGERGVLVVRIPSSDIERLRTTLSGLSANVRSLKKESLQRLLQRLQTLPKARIGLYQPWTPSMDEGWTRLVFERAEIPYATLHDADIRAGGLNDRVDTIVLPSISSRTIREGYGPDQSEPKFVGGLGTEGTAALRDFVRRGGVLVCLEDSSRFAIEALNLPVTDVLKGVASSAFYCPGSLVRVEYDKQARLARGMPDEGAVYFDHSLAFAVKDGTHRVVARYAAHSPLESGWLHGADKIEGKAALVVCNEGQGRVVLFGFPPQHRGQTQATFRLLFNALYDLPRPAP